MPSTLAGRTLSSQSNEAMTILSLTSDQDCQMLQEWFKSNPEGRVSVDVQDNQELNTEESDGVPVETILPWSILSTHLLKNLFFNCIEQNAKDGAGAEVTTEQIFSTLFYSLKEESRRIPYYFIPTQGFASLETISDDDRCKLMLVTTIIHNLLNVTSNPAV